MKWQVVSKNHATGEWSVVKPDIDSKEKADKFAERCTMNESNKDIVYEVKQQD